MKLASKLQKFADPVLREAGYQQIDDLVYKALWSTRDVEHFVYFLRHPKESGSFVGQFGLRNPEAEEFSVSTIRAYGGSLFDSLRYDETKSCTMLFSFGRFVPPLWSLGVSTLAPEDIAARVEQVVRDLLVPAIGTITTVAKLLTLLSANAEPCPWGATNGAIRAAQIVALANKAGFDSAQTEAILKDRYPWIANGLSKASELKADPGAYVKAVIRDWRARGRASGQG